MALRKWQFRALLFLLFTIINKSICADNWHASINSSIQMDNRFSPDSTMSADTAVSYAYDDAGNDVHSRLNFLIRESEYSFQRGKIFYELSVEKGLSEYNTRIKAGRFERSDNLGFYFLDGLSLNYLNTKNDFGLELYVGRPGRIDDVYSIEGDYLLGAEVFSHQQHNWKNKLLPFLLDTTDVRLGVQKIKNISIANRVNLAVNTEGKSWLAGEDSYCGSGCKHFKSQFLLTYHTEQHKVEDLFVDVRVPVNKDLRLRIDYEYYRPEEILNPGFREQFYNYYAFGEQKIFRANVDYFFNNRISGFFEGLHSNREIGDAGLGYSAGIKLSKPFSNDIDMDISLSVDSVEYGDNKLDSIYIMLEHHINSRLNLQLDSIYRHEDKYRLGKNRVLGINGYVNYMARNNLLFTFEAREINNTRLRNEHLVRMSMTYYFDNFQAKHKEHKLINKNDFLDM